MSNLFIVLLSPQYAVRHAVPCTVNHLGYPLSLALTVRVNRLLLGQNQPYGQRLPRRPQPNVEAFRVVQRGWGEGVTAPRKSKPGGMRARPVLTSARRRKGSRTALRTCGSATSSQMAISAALLSTSSGFPSALSCAGQERVSLSEVTSQSWSETTSQQRHPLGHNDTLLIFQTFALPRQGIDRSQRRGHASGEVRTLMCMNKTTGGRHEASNGCRIGSRMGFTWFVYCSANSLGSRDISATSSVR